jgi:hypothetical protein
MALVQNLRLDITRLDDKRSEVLVTYEIAFTAAEVLAGATFLEKVSLRGDDAILDEDIGGPLYCHAIKAETPPLAREIRRTLLSRELDEDLDRRVLGSPVRRADELYARVALTPFVAAEAILDSNVVRGSFGRLGRSG